MKHKKHLLAGSVVTLVIFTVLIIYAVIFSKSTESRNAELKDPDTFSAAEFRDTLKQGLIQRGLEIPENNLLVSEETYNELKDTVKRAWIKNEIL